MLYAGEESALSALLERATVRLRARRARSRSRSSTRTGCRRKRSTSASATASVRPASRDFIPTPARRTRSPPASSSSAIPTPMDSTRIGRWSIRSRDPAGLLPQAPDDTERRDLGMNGSYLVFRQLSQDVDALLEFFDEQTRRRDGASNAEARLSSPPRWSGAGRAARRWSSRRTTDDPAFCDDNDFLYHSRSGDEHGFKCPIGSHIRRTNPRDSLEPDPGSERSIEVGKRHRDPPARPRLWRAGGGFDGDRRHPRGRRRAGDRGLHFICFNTHIGRQFEFIQHTWMNNPKFDGLYEDDDPLVGDRGGARREARRGLHDSSRARPHARHRDAAVRARPRRRLLLHAGHPRATVPGIPVDPESLSDDIH